METEAIQAYESKGIKLLDSAKDIVIINQSTREYAVEFTAGARRAIKAIEDEFRPDIDKAHTLHKDLLARLKKLTSPFKEAKAIVDAEISRDYMEQEQMRREKERQARVKADAERKRQEDALTKQAEEAIKEGDVETAEALVDSKVITAPIVPVAKVEQTIRTTAGQATVRKDIKVELVNKKAVIEAVANGAFPSTFLTVDMGVVKRYAKTAGLTFMQGFHITETAIVSGRAK